MLMFLAQPRGSPHPRARHIARTIADKRDDLLFKSAEPLLDRLQIREDLARMLVVSQRVDGGDAGKFGEFLDIALGKSADDRAMNHPAQHAGGVLDGFAPPKRTTRFG